YICSFARVQGAGAHPDLHSFPTRRSSDLHYERFTSAQMTRANTYTSGKIYFQVLQKDLRGEYQGTTVQVIPHITDAVKAVVREADRKSTTSELQSRENLVCRLLLEKKKHT